MPRTITVTVHLADKRQFRRLVDFVVDCESLASINADDELQALVDECRNDLINLNGKTEDHDG